MLQNMTEVNSNNWEDEVIKSKVPVLVDFWAEWCGPCKTLSPILDQLAGELKDKVKFVSVNVESNMDLAQNHNIRSVPTMMLFVGGNKTSDKMVGAMNKTAIVKILEKYIEKDSK